MSIHILLVVQKQLPNKKEKEKKEARSIRSGMVKRQGDVWWFFLFFEEILQEILCLKLPNLVLDYLKKWQELIYWVVQ
jgi:hypothetical protein